MGIKYGKLPKKYFQEYKIYSESELDSNHIKINNRFGIGPINVHGMDAFLWNKQFTPIGKRTFDRAYVNVFEDERFIYYAPFTSSVRLLPNNIPKHYEIITLT